MHKILKKILPCLLVITSILTITSCTKNKYKYPSQVPALSEDVANKTFVKIGNLTITNKEVYNRLAQSYGVATLKDFIDEKLLSSMKLTSEQEKDYEKYLDTLIYGTEDVDSLTDEEKEKAEKDFVLTCASSGLTADDAKKDSPLYYKNYYLTAYKRYLKTVEVITKEIKDSDAKVTEENKDKADDKKADLHFTDESYLNYFNGNYHKHYKAIIVTFDSEKQAKDTMNACNIDLSSIAGAWKDRSGNLMDAAKLEEVFKNMYYATYGKETEATDYTYDDLVKIASTSSKDTVIATKLIKLSTKELFDSYTHGPLAYNGRWYLALCTSVSDEYFNDDDPTIKYVVSDSEVVKEENNAATELSDSIKEKLFATLVEKEIASSTSTYQNNIERVMYQLRQEAGLEIFAEGIETSYKTNYNSIFSTLGITDYDTFKETSNVSSTVVAKWNDGELNVNEFFNKLTERYGALITLLFSEQYVVLTSKFNTVVDFQKGTILDQKKYDSYVKEDYTAYKEAFEQGNFESYGFSKEYGWENFLRDYIGITDEFKIVTDFNGTLYSDVLAKYKENLYMVTVDDVKLEVISHEDGTKTWALNSSKWNQSFDTKVEVVNENVLPSIFVAEKLEDLNLDSDKLSKLTLNDVYGHFVLRFKNSDGVSTDALTPVSTNQAIYPVYDAIYDETFSATVSGIYVYYDADLDGVADEVSEDDAKKALELTEILWNNAKSLFAPNKENTISENLKTVVREYMTASISSEYGSYKQAGLRVQLITGSTYSNTTTAPDNVLAAVKENWTNIVNYKDTKDGEGKIIGTTITGQNLDPVYRYLLNSNVYYVTAYDFIVDKAIYGDNGYYRLAVTKATSRTSKYIDESKQTYPTLYQYEQSLLDSDDRDITISTTLSTRISTYYTPAIKRLTKDSIVNKALMTDCNALLDSITFTNNNDANKSILEFIIAEAIKTAEEDK